MATIATVMLVPVWALYDLRRIIILIETVSSLFYLSLLQFSISTLIEGARTKTKFLRRGYRNMLKIRIGDFCCLRLKGIVEILIRVC